MATIKDLQDWIAADLGMRCSANKKIYTVVTGFIENKRRYKFNVYTFTNCYIISAVERDDGGYLGCTAQARKSRPGEGWFRGNDLPDGKLNRKTWNSILKGIICYELEDICRQTNTNKNDDFHNMPDTMGKDRTDD